MHSGENQGRLVIGNPEETSAGKTTNTKAMLASLSALTNNPCPGPKQIHFPLDSFDNAQDFCVSSLTMS